MRDFIDLLKNRISSQFLASYTVFWIIFNWRIIYVTLFIDQNLIYEKTGLLRIEYINEHRQIFGFSPNVHESLYRVLSFVIPFVLALAYVKIALRFLTWIYRVEISEKYKKRDIKDEEDFKFEESKIARREKIVDRKESVIEKEETVKKIEQNTKTAQRKEWDKDYEKLMKTTDSNRVIDITKKSASLVRKDNINVSAIQTAVIFGLIIALEKNVNFFAITDKGKYFIIKSQDENNAE